MEDNTQNHSTQPPPRDWRLLVGLIASLVLLGFVLAYSLNGPSRTPMRYLFPQGFTGKYSIELGVKTAAPLPVEDGFLVLQIPKDGQLQTSSVLEEGWAKDEYYFVSPDGTRTLLPLGEENSIVQQESVVFSPTGKSGTMAVSLEGFIGTAAQRRRSGELIIDNGK
jgi:hypothetical protein